LGLNNYKITSLADGINSGDAINKGQLDTLENNVYSKTDADNRYYLNTVTLNNIVVPTNSVDFNNQKAINVGDATSATDALNR